MKQIYIFIFVLVSFQISTARAQTVSQSGQFTFKVNDPVYYAHAPGKIAAIGADGTYTFKRDSDGDVTSRVTYELLALAKPGTCLTRGLRFCVGYPAFHNHKKGEIVAIGGNGKMTFLRTEDKDVAQYIDPQEISLAQSRTCGSTTPRFCVDEPVYHSNSLGKIGGVSVSGSYTFVRSSDDDITQRIAPESLQKVQTSSVGANSLTCEGVELQDGGEAADIANNYKALAKVSTVERANFLNLVSQHLVKLNHGHSNVFARLVFAKIVNMSTAKVVRESFAQAVENDLKDLRSYNWMSIDQLDPQPATIDFALRVLFAAVRLRMTLPYNSEANLESFASRLSKAAAEEKFSDKLFELKKIAKEMEPILIELLQDPRHRVLGTIGDDVAGWISRK